MLLRIVAVAALALAGSACGGGTKQAAQSLLPPGCSTSDVHGIVVSFLSHPAVAPPPTFSLYRTTESDGRTFTTHNGRAAVAHATARLRLGERDRVIQLRVAPQDINHVKILFTLTRVAPDFPARGIHARVASGSGTIDCAHQKIASWTVTGP